MHNKPEKLRLITESLRQGVLLTQAISDAGIRSHKTIADWIKKDPRINKLIKSAQELCASHRLRVVEDALYKNAQAGNVTAQIFFLKNQDPSNWKDRTESINKHEGSVIHTHEVNYASYGITKDDVAQHANALLAKRQGTTITN